MTVYVSIGNSDDKLTQRRWSEFYRHVDSLIRDHASVVHGAWVSPSTQPWQNACWAFDPTDDHDRDGLRIALKIQARIYQQDSIAWCEGVADFICPKPLVVSQEPIPIPGD